jgi:hypothetical protein
LEADRLESLSSVLTSVSSHSTQTNATLSAVEM